MYTDFVILNAVDFSGDRALNFLTNKIAREFCEKPNDTLRIIRSFFFVFFFFFQIIFRVSG